MTLQNIDFEYFSKITADLKLSRDATTKLHLDFQKLIDTLVASDELMHNIILYNQGKSPKFTDNPLAFAEYGLVLHWVVDPPSLVKTYIDNHSIVKVLWEGLKIYVEMNDLPKVTADEYTYLLKNISGEKVVVAPDGTLFGAGTYEQLDDHWAYAFFNYLINLADKSSIADFGTTPYQKIRTMAVGESVTVALIGDWGTGKYSEDGSYDPALQVIEEVKHKNPDYLIHLGDVYYAGTDERVPAGEEQSNFIDMWPNMSPERSFTLNSNHEMYGGAQGYFNIALGRNGKATPFKHQNGTSYFSLTIGDFVFVGLDAAYYDPSALYMKGGLGDVTTPQPTPNGMKQQYNFLAQATSDKSKTHIILTHQTGLDAKGQQSNQLWQDLLSKDIPDYWYYGHLHLGVIYNDYPVSPGSPNRVKCRCVGHSAVPFGDAYGLWDKDRGKPIETVEWYAKTPAGVKNQPKIMKNGYMILTLSRSSSGYGISEAMYETGNALPVWSS